MTGYRHFWNLTSNIPSALWRSDIPPLCLFQNRNRIYNNILSRRDILKAEWEN